MTTEKRKRFEQIIRALQAKTVERGATEAEAMQAAAKARELMDRYEIDELSDEEIVGEGAVREFFEPKTMQDMTAARFIAVAIAAFTDTMVHWSPERAGQRIKKLAVVGLKSDVEFALYLLTALIAFGLAGAATQVARERQRYLTGYGIKITTRLNKLVNDRKAAAKTTGSRALVVVDLKKKAIDDFLGGVKFRKTRSRSVSVSSGAYAAGAARGEQATFSRPVGGGNLRLS